MENMELYLKGKDVPAEAKKPIQAGRLKGMTDINPMWRIKRLTEMFGACGVGWWYEITDKRLEKANENEVRAFVDINLYYSYNGETSKAIPGTGGSSYMTMERNGLYVSDECFKMALTDAISVASKAIGIGADVYFAEDRDKYTSEPKNSESTFKCVNCGALITPVKSNGKQISAEEIAERTTKKFGICLCTTCAKAADDASHEG